MKNERFKMEMTAIFNDFMEKAMRKVAKDQQLIEHGFIIEFKALNAKTMEKFEGGGVSIVERKEPEPMQ